MRPGGRGGTGRGTVSAHRFRHTVGTQLAERGAKLHTIMKVLGHTSVNMALVYAQISDQEVLRDYQAVLAPGATIAGPAAAELRNGTLPDTAVDWLKTNFFKTELELGRCLRTPAEGPCECDLYLTCAKFVTTPEYAPRLQARREVEHTLALDAAARGWVREVERHRCTADRIEKLLTDLGQPFDVPNDGLISSLQRSRPRRCDENGRRGRLVRCTTGGLAPDRLPGRPGTAGSAPPRRAIAGDATAAPFPR